MGTTTHIPLFKRTLGTTQTIEPAGPALTLHYAVPSDTDAIDGLAELDSAHAPRGVVPVADPFQPAGELVALLIERAQQLRRVQRGHNHLLPRGWPGSGYDRLAIG